MKRRRRRLLRVFGSIAALMLLLATAGIWGAVHYLNTPHVFLTADSPDGKYHCSVTGSAAADYDDTDVYIRDSAGVLLQNGVWRHTNGCFILSVDWDGDECRLWFNSSDSVFFRAICYNHRVIWPPLKSDSDLSQIDGCTTVKELEVVGPEVTDEGLMHLRSCSNLQQLGLDATCVSHAALESLKTALPKLKV